MEKTRIFLELIVGKTHTVEVLVHLRRHDTAWYHSSPDHKKELIALLGAKVLRKQFENDITSYHEKRRPKDPNKVEVGEKNVHVSKKVCLKRKRGKKDLPDELPANKPKRDITYAFSDSIQITYRLEEITPYESATLMVQAGTTKDLSVCHLPKLPKRLVLWCFPRKKGFDATDPDPEDSGFPRPELIPIGSLFRSQIIDNDETK